jgi:FKBP-type peptidyl-prolyl cis-trans isomerase SlyD
MVVTQGLVVSLEYTLRLDNEEIIDSTDGKAPLTYTHGAQEIITGLEKELEGMAVGERKQVTVSPSDGYGEVHPEGRFEVAKDRVPLEALRIGATLQGEGPDGKPVYPHVAEIRDSTVLLDLNHPLAGQTLHFDVKVVDIQTGQA